MGDFRYRMAQFLMGRNGFDNFCRGLLFLAMILIIADILVPGSVLRLLGLIVLIYSYFRAFSGKTSPDGRRKTPGTHPACRLLSRSYMGPGPQAL